MTEQGDSAPPPRRGWADKRAAISRGARVVFARDGYAGASIDAIAVEAGVSTRTIYNHFGDKERLFTSVILESSAQVRDALVAQTTRLLDTVTDLEADLIALAHAWVATMEEFAEHFALARLITTDAAHLPPDLRQAWQNAGPRAARAELARHFGLLTRQGLLSGEDPDRAATHFHLLTFTEITERSGQGAEPLAEAETNEIIEAGVRTFLHGYLPGPHDCAGDGPVTPGRYRPESGINRGKPPAGLGR
ncbi:MAG: TetR/AcrR family transcriptional regulator [Trebonia sp.]